MVELNTKNESLKIERISIEEATKLGWRKRKRRTE